MKGIVVDGGSEIMWERHELTKLFGNKDALQASDFEIFLKMGQKRS